MAVGNNPEDRKSWPLNGEGSFSTRWCGEEADGETAIDAMDGERRAHLLLQTGTRTFSGEFGGSVPPSEPQVSTSNPGSTKGGSVPPRF